MKVKKALLLSAILWFAVTAAWTAIIAIRWSFAPEPDWLYALQALVALLSLAAGVINLVRWRQTKKDT